MPDKYEKIYPIREKIDMVVSYSANSNWGFTIDIVDKLIAPYIESEDTWYKISILCDDFKDNRKKVG